MDRIAIKERSKQILKKNHWLCVIVTLISGIVPTLMASASSVNANYTETTTTTTIPSTEVFQDFDPLLFIVAIISALAGTVISLVIHAFVTNQLAVGTNRFFLKFRKNNPTDIGELFTSYKDKTFLNVAKVTFIRYVFVYLWSMLFIIPGIIKAFEYWAVDYILAVRPDTPYQKAIDLSKKMMNGHKMDVFVMGLSFTGWYLLSIFTCGILSVAYVNPYAKVAMTELYAEIREDAIRRGVISPYDVPDYMDYQPQSPYYPYYNANPQQPMANGYYNPQAQQPMANGYYSPQAQQPVNPYAPVNTAPQYGAYPQPQGVPQAQPFAYGQPSYPQPVQAPVQSPYQQAPVQYPAQLQQFTEPVAAPVEAAPIVQENPEPVSEAPATPDVPEDPEIL